MSRVCCFELLSVRLSTCPAVRLAFNCQLACAIWIHNRASFSLVFVLWPLCGAVRAVCTPNGWHLSPSLTLSLCVCVCVCVYVSVCACEWVGWSAIKTIKYEWRHVAEICFAKCRKTLAYQITTQQTNSKHKHAMCPPPPAPCHVTPFCCTPTSSGIA